MFCVETIFPHRHHHHHHHWDPCQQNVAWQTTTYTNGAVTSQVGVTPNGATIIANTTPVQSFPTAPPAYLPPNGPPYNPGWNPRY